MRASSIVTRDTPYETMTMTFEELPEFQKERKRLARKYRSLAQDLVEFRNIISVIPLGNQKHFAVIAKNDYLHIVKARLFCRYLKGSSLRIIYSFWEDKQRIEFIELYFKGDKANEDRQRVKEYLTKYQD